MSGKRGEMFRGLVIKTGWPGICCADELYGRDSMAKTKKQTAPWLVLLESVGLALGVYLGGLALLAALAVRGGVGEGAVFPVLAALCLGASLGGGLLSARRLPWGTLPSALLAAGCFAGVLALVGFCGWDGLALAGRGGVLLLCAVGGGLLAGILGGRRKGRRKRK